MDLGKDRRAMAGEIENIFPTSLPRIGEESEEARQLARARAGDQAAIGWLIARYRSRAIRLAARVLRRSDEAEDVAQEAFIRAFRHLHAFRGEGRFYTWLYHIVVRICLDRQRIRRWNAEETIDLDALRSEAAHLSAADIENHVLVEMLLDRLSPPMRAMLVLRELEGLEYEEIARVLEIPVGRVKWRLHEARSQFRVLWQDVMREVERV
jgi:RNA polymerase sigma-70 factor (ECF subfamily)